MPPTSTLYQTGRAVDYTPGSAVTAGDLIVQGQIVGVPANDIASGDLGALSIDGVFKMPKTTGAGTAIGVGEGVWFDTVNKVASLLPGTNMCWIGYSVLAAATTDAVVYVKLVDGPAPIAWFVHSEANLAAGADLSSVKMPGHPLGGRLVSAEINFLGASSGVDNSNTSVLLIANAAGTTIVTKTYNTATQPPNGQESIGTPDLTAGVLAAREQPRFSITNGATADVPAFEVVYGILPRRSN